MKINYIVIVLMVILTSSVYSQSNNITNTIGTNGSFIIKDATNTFVTLDQATGLITTQNSNISLGYASGATPLGVIYKGTESFIHDYRGTGTFGNNTFVGIGAGNFTMGGTADNGSFNSAFGVSSLNANTTGNRNAAFGNGTLQQNTTGYENSAFGENALTYNIIGYRNSAFGLGALIQSIGNNNSAFGNAAGNNVTTGTNLTIIGSNAQPSAGNATNEITLGNSLVVTLRCNTSTITSLSDARDKKNIQYLELGIDFLMKLKPRQFNWDKREWYGNKKSDGSKMQKAPSAGFIAQELDTVQMSENAEWLNLVLKTNPNKLEATSGNLLPIIVKAIQDLKNENDVLKSKNEMSQVVNENLINRLNTFERRQTQLVAELEKLKATNTETTKVSLRRNEN